MDQVTDTSTVQEPVGPGPVALGVSLILASASYRPLVFWAQNAWDLAEPARVFTASLAVFIIGTALLLFLARMGFKPLPSAFVVAALIFIVFGWAHLAAIPPLAWLGIWAVGSILVYQRASDGTLRAVSYIVLTLLLLAPAVQVGVQHYQQRTTYPLVDLEPPVGAVATGAVEDVVVVILDSYPMFQIARDWFGHDTEPVQRALVRSGFEYFEVAWSHNTFTGLAVPSILQLHQVVDASPKGSWGNRRSGYDIVRGSNFVAGTLRNAGFEYTHIEGGWDGTVCGSVDNCLHSAWLDESNWNLLSPSVVGPLFASRLGSMEAHNTARTVENLRTLDSLDDGQHDYVYAHLMLPHIPYVVDSNCRVVPSRARTDDDSDEALRDQLACVDSLVMSLLPQFADDTAVLITGDHGTGHGEPPGSSSAWTDPHIAERLGVFLSYKLPEICERPQTNTNVDVMRQIMECAVDGELPSEAVPFMLGANQPVEIDRARLSNIELRLLNGNLSRDSS